MPRSPLRLIVVEDHANTAEGLKKFLKAVGYQVFVATDMASALWLASSVQFDLLLSDLGLPDGTGWELLKQLKAKRHIRAIAFSAHNSPEDLNKVPRPDSSSICPNRSCPTNFAPRSSAPLRQRRVPSRTRIAERVRFAA